MNLPQGTLFEQDGERRWRAANHDRVGNALDLSRAGLPFIDRDFCVEDSPEPSGAVRRLEQE